MPIDVTCPNCLSRFRVKDVFAGKKGPCPKCKHEIRVPGKDEQVVIHGAAEYEGIKDSTGRAVLKPIAREKLKVSTNLVVGVAGGAVMVLVISLLLGFARLEGAALVFILSAGAILLGPPLAWGGYAFLRDDELEPYEGMELVIRVAACSLLYAALWGLYVLTKSLLLAGGTPELWHLVFIVPPFVAAGGFVGATSFDLEYSSGCLHYSLYLLVTVLLRMIVTLEAQF